MRIASLHVYPVKGCRAIDVTRSDVLRSGLRHDRRFMIVDGGGAFVTQRQHPALALVETAFDGDTIVLTTPSKATARIPLHGGDGPRRRVVVWKDEVEAIEVPGDGAALLSEHLGGAMSLVFMPDDVVRQVDRTYAREGDRVGFADGYPVLFAFAASHASLVGAMETPVPIDRFRANVVVDGGAAWDEERHARLTAGTLPFRTPKRCVRCDVTLVDQATAVKGKEPLRTLARLRRSPEGVQPPVAFSDVCFAMNAIPDGEGHLAVGDPVAFTAG